MGFVYFHYASLLGRNYCKELLKMGNFNTDRGSDSKGVASIINVYDIAKT